jgi:hypothetical protein
MASPLRALQKPWLFARAQKSIDLRSHAHAFDFWCAANDFDPRGFLDAPGHRRSDPKLPIMPPPIVGDRRAGFGNPRCSGWTPLHEACYLGNPIAAAAIARMRPDWAFSLDDRGRAPLRAIFLFNDTAPGWKHPGPYLPGARLSPLGDDATLFDCCEILLSLGARPQGAELCSAAYLGMSRCCELLTRTPRDLFDKPDEHFPEWALTRELFAKPIDGLTQHVACALHGLAPSIGLQLAISCPSEHDEPNIRAFVRTKQFDMAERLIGSRPWTALAALLELSLSAPIGLGEAERRARARLASTAIERAPRSPIHAKGFHHGSPCAIGALCALHGADDVLREILARAPLSPEQAALDLESARTLGSFRPLGASSEAMLERIALRGSAPSYALSGRSLRL